MKILGIIAEYDPFHNGHERHLRLAKEAVRPDYTWIILSGCFRQRGETAMLSPYDRARCALACGADAVFALPALWTVRDAEHYALGAVSILKEMGATHLAFGTETENPEYLEEIAEKLEAPDGRMRQILKERLAGGEGYPRALRAAVAEENPAYGEVLDCPNNTLAVCYLRALRRLGAEMTPVPVLRTGSYQTERIFTEAPSASALRDALRRGAYAQVYEAVPPVTRDALRTAFLRRRIPQEDVLDQLMTGRLRNMTREEILRLPDLSEGLGDLLMKTARQAGTRAELLDAASGRRYPRARISRICACALLGITREDTEQEPPREAVLLGLRNHPAMTALWRGKNVRTDFTAAPDLQAWRVWAQCAGLPDTLPWTEKVIRM